jgi:hypothetical protein
MLDSLITGAGEQSMRALTSAMVSLSLPFTSPRRMAASGQKSKQIYNKSRQIKKIGFV